jgi:undecaprenyl diphosphate synthase
MSKFLNIPQHLGVIIDGNRRWAKEKGLPRLEGHRKGLERVKELIKWSKDRGVKILTIFCFSTENWKRSKFEVNYLMKLLHKGIKEYGEKAEKEKIKIRVIGQKERLPKTLEEEINRVEEATKNNKEMTINFAISYGGRAELISAIQNIVAKKIPPEKITEQVISDNIWTSDLDLIIRTGKEQRLSNFLIWQAAYSELYFSPKYWPDFSEKDLDMAFEEYQKRQRRFGK